MDPDRCLPDQETGQISPFFRDTSQHVAWNTESGTRLYRPPNTHTHTHAHTHTHTDTTLSHIESFLPNFLFISVVCSCERACFEQLHIYIYPCRLPHEGRRLKIIKIAHTQIPQEVTYDLGYWIIIITLCHRHIVPEVRTLCIQPNTKWIDTEI